MKLFTLYRKNIYLMVNKASVMVLNYLVSYKVNYESVDQIPRKQ